MLGEKSGRSADINQQFIRASAAIQSIAIASMLSMAGASFAQDDSKSLAQAAQNPLASMISLPFQNNTNFNYGPEGGSQNTLNIQPVWPFKMNDDWNFVTRTILPVVSIPALTSGDSRTTGLGDTTFTGWFSPSAASMWIWGAGPVLVLPTSTDDELGTGEWSAGASVVVLTMPGDWVIGSLFSNVWDVSGSVDVNFFTWQPIINYNLSDGWYLASVPIITANWEADSDQRWTVPVGGGVGKIFRIGKQPINMSVHVYYNAIKPDVVGDWTLRIQFQLMFPR
jgi:hypothetical protein